MAGTDYFDSTSEAIERFARATVAGEASEAGRAVRLFYAVRDGWRYDPFKLRLAREEYVASNVHAAGHGYCITKAILLTAAARAAGFQPRSGWRTS